jgi:SAM-dependent methyltransferase
MKEYWESRFKEEGAMWKFEPSDSAIIALETFTSHGIDNILIPGFGYGRNARLFYDSGFKIIGIEISGSAIRLAEINGISCKIHHGSVTAMPFDNEQYGGIFCYALLHLLNKRERLVFLQSCYNQLKIGGLMIFTVVSKKSDLYGKGRQISNDRFRMSNGLNVYFYDSDSVKDEFRDFGLLEFREIDEPIKFMVGEKPLKCIIIICKKR